MRDRQSGFTLLELMVVMAIIGVLSSIALPAFRSMQLRSRQAERAMMLQAIHASIEEHFLRENRFPGFDPSVPEASSLLLNNNPGVFAFTGQKMPWRLASWGDHWNDLGLRVEGNLYYVYWGAGNQNRGTRQYWLVAQADLDVDGTVSTMQRLYSYQGAVLETWAGAPPSCKCTFQWDVPNGAF